MVARVRKVDESYEDYRNNLIAEAYDLKLRLRMGPSGYKLFQEWRASHTINIDSEDKDGNNRENNTGQGMHTRRLQTSVRNNTTTQSYNRSGKQRKRNHQLSKRGA